MPQYRVQYYCFVKQRKRVDVTFGELNNAIESFRYCVYLAAQRGGGHITIHYGKKLAHEITVSGRQSPAAGAA